MIPKWNESICTICKCQRDVDNQRGLWGIVPKDISHVQNAPLCTACANNPKGISYIDLCRKVAAALSQSPAPSNKTSYKACAKCKTEYPYGEGPEICKSCSYWKDLMS